MVGFTAFLTQSQSKQQRYPWFISIVRLQPSGGMSCKTGPLQASDSLSKLSARPINQVRAPLRPNTGLSTNAGKGPELPKRTMKKWCWRRDGANATTESGVSMTAPGSINAPGTSSLPGPSSQEKLAGRCRKQVLTDCPTFYLPLGLPHMVYVR